MSRLEYESRQSKVEHWKSRWSLRFRSMHVWVKLRVRSTKKSKMNLKSQRWTWWTKFTLSLRFLNRIRSRIRSLDLAVYWVQLMAHWSSSCLRPSTCSTQSHLLQFAFNVQTHQSYATQNQIPLKLKKTLRSSILVSFCESCEVPRGVYLYSDQLSSRRLSFWSNKNMKHDF